MTKQDEYGNPIHSSDKEAEEFLRENGGEYSFMFVSEYRTLRKMGRGINEARHDAILSIAKLTSDLAITLGFDKGE